LLGEVAVIGAGLDLTVVDGDETYFPLEARVTEVMRHEREKKTRRLTVVVGLLVVHVNDTTGPDLGHLVTIECFNFSELARLNLIATILGEENRDRVVTELVSARLEARLLIVRVTTPGVDVVTPEINAFFLASAIKVVCHVHTDRRVIVSSITNTHGAVVLGLDIPLHITNSGLDEGAGISCLWVIRDLIPCEETNDVGVLGQLIDHRRIATEQVIVPLGVVANNRFTWRGQVGNNVYSSIAEQLHALCMIGLGVNGVYTDSVGIELLKVRDIALACFSIG
jgi:hypothetical protein